jgi:hypothetical protein
MSSVCSQLRLKKIAVHANRDQNEVQWKSLPLKLIAAKDNPDKHALTRLKICSDLNHFVLMLVSGTTCSL